jgi:salicylate hydroxylase
MTELPFLIAGGGIAGLAAAIGLSGLGPVRLFERAEAFEEVGAGLQMSPNGVRALQELGAWDAVDPACVIPSEIHIRDGRSGKILQRISLGRDFEKSFGAPYRVCHRADLLAGLAETARQNPAIELAAGRSVTGLQQEAAPILRLADGEMAKGRAVIAADGIRSTLREAVCGRIEPVDRGHTIFRALIPMASVPPEIEADCVTLWLCPGGHVVHYPVSNWRSFNVVAVSDVPAEESGWGIAAPSRSILECLPGISDVLAGLLGVPNEWLRWQGADLPELPCWSNGSVVLVGDAAHATLPFLAQGAVMALEDACILRRDISANSVLPSAFLTYEGARKARTSRIQSQSRRMGRLYHLNGIAGHARNLGFSLMGPNAALRQMSWIYGWKPETSPPFPGSSGLIQPPAQP